MSRSSGYSYSSNTCSTSNSTKFTDVDQQPIKNSINGIHRFDSFTPRKWECGRSGVQIKEADVGQPCAECSQCKEGFEPHKWRKSCKNCKCSRDGHEVIAEHGARSRLGFLGHESLDARTLGYTFVPPGLTTARQVDQYYSSLPSEEVPKLGSKGETIRSQRIVRQLPKQDLSLSACKFVESEYATSYEDFVSGRNQVALDVGMAKTAPPNGICVGCDRPVSPQQIVVAAPRLGSSVWHPGCFKCTDCDDLLVDLVYCAYEDSIYCERHYAEKMKPRCAGCDEVQGWNGQNLNPLEYGWEKDEYERLAPKMCRKEIAPQDISKMALFNCKDGTSDRSCSCIKLGLKYSTKCCQCFGISCGNECIISEAN